MAIQDKIVKLYVKNYIIPHALIFDKPGFVDFRISGKTPIFARQILFPENFFVTFEKQFIEKFGVRGERILYSIGKKFGYSFAQQGHFENIKGNPGKKVNKWINIASHFVEGTYASMIRPHIDNTNQLVEYTLKNFVICRKLGYDLFFATGGTAGLISWMFQNNNIEACLYDSRGFDETHTCNVLAAPAEIVKSRAKNGRFFTETNLSDLAQNPSEYEAFNKETTIKYTKSFQTFLDAKVIEYHRGIISHKGQRFFLFEVGGMYLLEKGMKDKEMQDLMFNSAFEVGKELFPGSDNKDLLGIMELISALGWGELTIFSGNAEFRVAIRHFPWTKYYKDIDYVIARGLFSGLFSRLFSRNIILEKPSMSISEGHLSLLFKSK
jgi:hypothetical protein